MNEIMMEKCLTWISKSFKVNISSVNAIPEMYLTRNNNLRSEYFISLLLAIEDETISESLTRQLHKERKNFDENLYISSKLKTESDVFLKEKINHSPISFMNDQNLSIETKVYYVLTYLDIYTYTNQENLLVGFLLYLVQEYRIDLANLVVLQLLKLSNDNLYIKQYTDFLRLHQNKDGSIGVINPLKNKKMDINQKEEWSRRNTISTVFLLSKLVAIDKGML